jgi:hypothetical protein
MPAMSCFGHDLIHLRMVCSVPARSVMRCCHCSLSIRFYLFTYTFCTYVYAHLFIYIYTQVVTEMHLLQFGMMMGESSAELAIGMQGAAQPIGPNDDSLFGPTDCPGLYDRSWEHIIEEHKEGLHYWASRRHIRKGLFMYKSRTGRPRVRVRHVSLYCPHPYSLNTPSPNNFGSMHIIYRVWH